MIQLDTQDFITEFKDVLKIKIKDKESFDLTEPEDAQLLIILYGILDEHILTKAVILDEKCQKEIEEINVKQKEKVERVLKLAKERAEGIGNDS